MYLPWSFDVLAMDLSCTFGRPSPVLAAGCSQRRLALRMALTVVSHPFHIQRSGRRARTRLVRSSPTGTA
jgi:hypothetical protein